MNITEMQTYYAGKVWVIFKDEDWHFVGVCAPNIKSVLQTIKNKYHFPEHFVSIAYSINEDKDRLDISVHNYDGGLSEPLVFTRYTAELEYYYDFEKEEKNGTEIS
jgi:hypothetical protein